MRGFRRDRNDDGFAGLELDEARAPLVHRRAGDRMSHLLVRPADDTFALLGGHVAVGGDQNKRRKVHPGLAAGHDPAAFRPGQQPATPDDKLAIASVVCVFIREHRPSEGQPGRPERGPQSIVVGVVRNRDTALDFESVMSDVSREALHRSAFPK